MWNCLSSNIRILRCCHVYLPPVPISSFSPSLFFRSFAPISSMDNTNSFNQSSSSITSFAQSSKSGGGGGGKGRGYEIINDGERWRGCSGGRGGGGKDEIDALGRLLTRILRHLASELNLNMRSDGYVKVEDLLKLNMKTSAKVPLRSHTVDDIREAVGKDNKQRFSLSEENGELLIRANQGHTITTVESESLLRPILSAEEVLVCVHGTYKRNLDSILDSGLKRMKRLHVHFSCGLPTESKVISGMRRDVNVLIFLNVKIHGFKICCLENPSMSAPYVCSENFSQGDWRTCQGRSTYKECSSC